MPRPQASDGGAPFSSYSKREGYASPMTMFGFSRPVATIVTAALLAAGAAGAQVPRFRDQDQALSARKSGLVMPLRQIEERVVPRMAGARYLGPEIHDDGRYRLKFMRGDQLIWVDVDGRSGTILGRSGN